MPFMSVSQEMGEDLVEDCVEGSCRRVYSPRQEARSNHNNLVLQRSQGGSSNCHVTFLFLPCGILHAVPSFAT